MTLGIVLPDCDFLASPSVLVTPAVPVYLSKNKLKETSSLHALSSNNNIPHKSLNSTSPYLG